MFALVTGSELYNADQLAGELRVTRRTVYRDLQTLRASGVDIRFDSESRSFHSIYPSKMRPILNLDDLLILALAAHVSPLALDTSASRSIRSAVASLTGALSKPVRHELGALLSAIGVSCKNSMEATTKHPLFDRLVIAIRRRRAIRITFKSAELFKQTKFAPYRIEFVDNDAWLIGRSTVHRCVKCFCLNEIDNLEVLDDEFQLPRNLTRRCLVKLLPPLQSAG